MDAKATASVPAAELPGSETAAPENSLATSTATAGANAPSSDVLFPTPQKTATVAHVGQPAPLPSSPGTAGSLGGALFALVLVIGLILGLGWLARRMPGFGGISGQNNPLRVVASLSLGPRERVVVVDVGGTQLLLGVGAGGTRTLHTLAEPLPAASPTATPAFAQLLAQHFGKKA